MLLDQHRAKILSPAAIAGLVGPRPRAKRVVLCNGVFDIVHPGHQRHLLYARSKADILVCSVTGDNYVPKGAYRPHVPQDLRASNLAMFDIVDYVVISDAPTPHHVIETIQPDFYAKGFEYAPSEYGRDIGETAAVEAYGGEVLFTPGDVVYSSSELINNAAPDLRWEKLALAMERAGVSFADLRATVAAMKDQSVHVIGDTIVDRVTHGEMLGWNGKTFTPSVRRDHAEDFVGGAAVVAKHVHAAGAAVKFTTVLGADDAGGLVMRDLVAAGIDLWPIVDGTRPTTIKEVVVVDGQRVFKLDTVDSRSISDAVLAKICEEVGGTDGGAVVFSDFRHGIFNARTIPRLVAAIPEGRLRAADSQVASRWGNVTDFAGFSLITPNEREARFCLADQDSGVRPLAHALYARAKCDALLMKMGARGVLGCGLGGDSFVLDSFASTVVDPVGAGDAFLAYAVLSGRVYGDQRGALEVAAILGSFAAALECGYDGNVPVTADAVLSKIDEAEKELK